MNLDPILLDSFHLSDATIKSSFAKFIKQEQAYRNQFLQAKLNSAFDGYSFIGQTDSLNQYETDLLHSFVLSDLLPLKSFPKEFYHFMANEWLGLIETVQQKELELIKKHNLPFAHLYRNNHIAYMMSCNYYPEPKNYDVVAQNNTRLSAHTDVSLFTTFPFGIAEGLSYFNGQSKKELKETDEAVQFTGYFAEFLSNGETMALQHQVELPNDLESERYSFAIFSIPKPDSLLQVGNQKLTGNDYYSKYLSLF